jgi:hypothetical protein
MAELPLSTAIYQLRLELAGISPIIIIWRRLLVSIAQLHQYIQVSFDWSGEHWHRFRVHGKDYGIAYLGGRSFDDDPHQVPLSRFRLHPRESFRTSQPTGGSRFGWRRFCLRISAFCRSAWVEERRRRAKNMRAP